MTRIVEGLQPFHLFARFQALRKYGNHRIGSSAAYGYRPMASTIFPLSPIRLEDWIA